MKIILSALIAIFVIGCSEEAPKEVAVETTKEVKAVEAAKTPVVTESAVVEKVAQVKETVVEKVAAVAEVAAVTVDGALLYSKCAGCHGKSGEMSALNKSAVISDWSVTQIQDALNGYKAGTYGGSLKGMMIGQAKDLSEEDITAIAEYIAKK
ncbi:c-type cytochrome [Sulfurimonas sp.]|nr:c-type cytochrome [Sulfurimonas sp.]